MTSFYLALAVLAGGMLPVQAAVNARLARVVGGPVWAAAVSGLVLTVVLAVVASAASRGGPRLTGLDALPWWAWIGGGLCGAILLSATTAIAPRLGAGSMIALVMTGQVLGSLALDSFGLLGLATEPLSIRRSIAGALLVIGAILMR
ncbi:MAG TPA: DMT family transporter [Lysobacter sp.]|nr:DMT family transporter [Lysobacter sp.]